MAEKIKLKVEIDGLDKANKELEQLEKNASDLQKELSGLDKNSDQFKQLNKDLEETNKQIVKTKQNIGLLKDAAGEIGLDEKFDDVYQAALPLTGRLGELEDRMYALALAGQQNSAGFQKLQEEAANIRKTIQRVDESVDDLAANKGISTFGESIGALGQSLISLDFDRAAKQAQGLANNVSNLKFGNVISGVKNLGSVFISLGKALLMNPIVWIAAAIAAIVVAVVALLNKLGLLKPIVDLIGKAFKIVGDIIDSVVEGFKALTDWLGLTDNAGEKMAENQMKRTKAALEAQKNYAAERTRQLDNEIRMMELLDDGSEKSLKKRQAKEKEKLTLIQKTAVLEEKAAKAELANAIKKGEADAEELKALRQKVVETQRAYRQSVDDIKYFNKAASKELDDFRKEQDEKNKEQDEKEKEDRQKKLDAWKEYQKQRLAAARLQEDLNLELMKEGTEKELEENRVKYERLRQDTLSNTDLTRKEREAINALYDRIELQNATKIQDAIAQKQKDIDKEAEDKRKEEAKKRKEQQDDLLDELYEAEQKALLDARDQELYDLKKSYNDKYALAYGNAELIAALKEQERKDIEAINAKYDAEEKKKEEEKLAEKIANVQKYSQMVGDILNAGLELAGAISELNQARTEAELITLRENLAAQGEEYQASYDQQKADLDAKLSAGVISQEQYNNTVKGLEENLNKSLTGLNEKQQKAELDAKKKAFESDKKMKIAQAIISGAQGAVSAFTGAMQLGPIAGPIVGAVLAAAVVATTAVQVAAIKATKFDGGASIPSASGGGGGSTGAGGGSAPTPPSINLFGQANAGSEGAGSQAMGARQQTIKAVVVESDITNTQNRLAQYQQRSEVG